MLSTALEWVARNKLNIPHIIHILDDFSIAAESFDTCKTSLQQFLTFCENVGVPMAPEKKTEGSSPVLTFAEIELDCSRNEARLPREKSGKMFVGNSQFAWEEESRTERAPISYWLIEFRMLSCNSRESFSSETDQSQHWHYAFTSFHTLNK